MRWLYVIEAGGLGSGMNRVHFLHIPKTGGTALGTALRPVAHAFSIMFHGHFMRLADIPIAENVVFMVRDPITRFVSGFNSRLRQGLPRHKIEWSVVEREGFARFPTANSLAEALSDSDLQNCEFAVRLIRGIFHVGIPLSFWLTSCEYLRSRADDIVWIILQPNSTRRFRGD